MLAKVLNHAIIRLFSFAPYSIPAGLPCADEVDWQYNYPYLSRPLPHLPACLLYVKIQANTASIRSGYHIFQRKTIYRVKKPMQ